MTNAHYHRGDGTWLSFRGKEFRFCGLHPWKAAAASAPVLAASLHAALGIDPSAGVGEIGLDRLKTKVVTSAQREIFLAQLAVAAELHRPVVLHGAKCWGEVVKAVKPFAGAIPSFLFHGFSRSEGLLPEIVALNGFVGVGQAVLNDHAVNYRALVSRLPLDRILVETDDDAADDQARDATLAAVFAKTVELTGLTEAQLDANAAAFIEACTRPGLCASPS